MLTRSPQTRITGARGMRVRAPSMGASVVRNHHAPALTHRYNSAVRVGMGEMPSDFTNELTASDVIVFSGAQAVERLAPGEYHGRIIETTHQLGDNGMGKRWYAVRLIDPSPLDVRGRIVHVGLDAWEPDE